MSTPVRFLGIERESVEWECMRGDGGEPPAQNGLPPPHVLGVSIFRYGGYVRTCERGRVRQWRGVRSVGEGVSGGWRTDEEIASRKFSTCI